MQVRSLPRARLTRRRAFRNTATVSRLGIAPWVRLGGRAARSRVVPSQAKANSGGANPRIFSGESAALNRESAAQRRTADDLADIVGGQEFFQGVAVEQRRALITKLRKLELQAVNFSRVLDDHADA